ncbi:3-keto-5-aminohexanoate cleavage protein, partial [Nocardia gipuzkoensis]
DFVSAPILLHGEDAGAWPVLAVAAARGLATRIGLEDVLTDPDATPVSDNAVLVAAARRLLTGSARE